MSNSFLDSGHNLSLVFGLVSVYTKENIKIVFRKQLLFCFFLVRGTRSAFRKLWHQNTRKGELGRKRNLCFRFQISITLLPISLQILSATEWWIRELTSLSCIVELTAVQRGAEKGSAVWQTLPEDNRGEDTLISKGRRIIYWILIVLETIPPFRSVPHGQNRQFHLQFYICYRYMEIQ